MGKGGSESYTPPDEWFYATPSSSFMYVLNHVCDQVD